MCGESIAPGGGCGSGVGGDGLEGVKWGVTSCRGILLSSDVFGGKCGASQNGCFNVSSNAFQRLVSRAWNPHSDNSPASFILGIINRRFWLIHFLLERMGLSTFLGFLHHAVRSREGMCEPSRLSIFPM